MSASPNIAPATAEITEREIARSIKQTPAARRPSSSSMGSGCCRAAGTTGSVLRGGWLRPGDALWPDDPETIEEARANPDVFAKKTLKQIADHTADVIGRLDTKPAVMGHSTGGLLTYMIADRGLSVASVAIDPGPFRGVLPLPISALKSAAPVLRNPLNRGRAITLTFDQFKYGWANALTTRKPAALRDLPRGRAGGRPDADGERQRQPVHRGEARSQEPRPWPAADHRRREGPHRPVGDRQRRLQAPEAQ